MLPIASFLTRASAPSLRLSTEQPLAEGAAAEESSAREAEKEKEASKAQRMLSLAGIRVASVPQDGDSSLSESIAQNQQPPSSASPLLLTPNGVSSSAKRRSSRGGTGAAAKGPPRFSLLRFLASTEVVAAAEGDAAATTAIAGAGAEGGAAAVSYGRGDLVQFTVVARRGQRQQSQRVGNVSLLKKAALPCR